MPSNYVVAEPTLQAVREPRAVLENLVRIGRHAVVSFPNFGYWRVRLQLLVDGRMPVTRFLPETWYETPNIHFCTIRDFVDLCAEIGITIERSMIVVGDGRAVERAPGAAGELERRAGHLPLDPQRRLIRRVIEFPAVFPWHVREDPYIAGKTFMQPTAGAALPAVRSSGRETLDSTEITRVQKFLREKFGNPKIRVVGRKQKDDSVEVYLGDEFIGVIFKDVEDGETSYAFQMAILDVDLDEVA